MKRVRCEFVRLTCLVSTAIAIVVVITVVVVACLFSTKEHFVSCAVCAVRGAACHIAQKFLPKCFRCSFPPQSRSRTRLRLRLCVSRLLLHVQLQQEQEQQLQMATHFRHLQHFLLATIVCQVAAATTAAPSVSSISNRTRCAVPLQLCC